MYLLLAVAGVTANFAHETIIGDDWTKTEKGQLFQEAKAEALVALDKVKEVAKGTQEYADYAEKAAFRDALMSDVNKEIENNKFYGFRDFQQFMGEFGWAFGLGMYSLFNLILVFIRKPKSMYGESLYHVTYLTISIFFIRWCFNRKDFFLYEYFAYNILTAGLTVISVYILVRYKEKKYKGLLDDLRGFKKVIGILFKGYYEDLEDKDLVNPEKVDEYEKYVVELTSEVENE